MRDEWIGLALVELTRSVAVSAMGVLLLSGALHAQRPAHPKPAGAKPPAPAAPKVTVPPLEFQLQGELKNAMVRPPRPPARTAYDSIVAEAEAGLDCGDANTLPVSWHGSLKPNLVGKFALEYAGLEFSVDGHVPFASVLRLPQSVRCAWTSKGHTKFFDADIQEDPHSELWVFVVLRNPLASGIVATTVAKLPVLFQFGTDNALASGSCTMTYYEALTNKPAETRTESADAVLSMDSERTEALAISAQEVASGFDRDIDINSPVFHLCLPGWEFKGKLSLHFAGLGGQAKPTLALNGCTDLAVGQASNVTAHASGAGGKYRFWLEPADPIEIAPLGESATLTGVAPGRTTLHVEHTSSDGKTTTATQPASCAKVTSINEGKPSIQLGLYDVKGKNALPVRVALQAEPAGEATTLLSFPAADPLLMSIAPGLDHLTLQGVKVGRTTVQAQTKCGQKTGPVLAVEIVPCDDEVIAELKSMAREVRTRMENNIAQQRTIRDDEEHNRAANEVVLHTLKLAAATLSAITTFVPAANKAVGAGKSVAATTFNGKELISQAVSEKTVEAANTIFKVGKVFSNAGDSGGDKNLINNAIRMIKDCEGCGKFSKAAGGYSLLKTAYDLYDASQKFGQDLGTLTGMSERLAELDEQLSKTGAELVDIGRRLYALCKASRDMSEPPTAAAQGGKGKEPAQEKPAQEKPSQEKQPARQPDRSNPNSQQSTVKSGDNKPADTDRPPIIADNPPITPTSGGRAPSGLLHQDEAQREGKSTSQQCGCGSRKLPMPQSGQGPAKEIRVSLAATGDCLQSFENGPVTDLKNVLEDWDGLISEVERANELPDVQRALSLKKLAPRMQRVPASFEAFNAAAPRFLKSLEKCAQNLDAAAQLLNANWEWSDRQLRNWDRMNK